MSDLVFTSDGAPGGGKGAAVEESRGLLPHYVSGAPFDPYAVERMTPAQERFYMASQWRMMWWKLLRHRVAVVSGAGISLTVGLLGVAVSFTLGIVIGGIAGYYGGWTDILIQRAIEVIQSFPHLPLWMALSAILPVSWSPLLVYLGITLILGMIEWTHLARALRSQLLSLREEDFCTAAVLMGAKPARIIGRHLLPSFMSHLIASATLMVPGMILGETALSFLGLGLRPPMTSWGVLLNEAQNINVVALYPWLMLPVACVIITVLAFNFFGDGLRDAADPYH